jgi:hypothetical protein
MLGAFLFCIAFALDRQHRQRPTSSVVAGEREFHAPRCLARLPITSLPERPRRIDNLSPLLRFKRHQTFASIIFCIPDTKGTLPAQLLNEAMADSGGGANKPSSSVKLVLLGEAAVGKA